MSTERELLLLGLLRQENMHGYRLNEFIESFMSICTDLKKPTAYFLLDKMEKDGWIERYSEQDGNRPARRVYRLTALGEQTFDALLRENLSAYLPVRYSTDIALAFSDALQPAETLALLGRRRAAMSHELDEIGMVPHHSGSLQYIIDHRAHHLKSELDWLDQVITDLSQRAETRTEASVKAPIETKLKP
jgi:DNA-binding PadR family transcriptional regulator